MSMPEDEKPAEPAEETTEVDVTISTPAEDEDEDASDDDDAED